MTNELEWSARLGAMRQQRDAAMNQIVELAARIAVLEQALKQAMQPAQQPSAPSAGEGQ